MLRATKQSGAFLTMTARGLVRGCRTCKAALNADMSCPKCGPRVVATALTDWCAKYDERACGDCGYIVCSANCETFWRKQAERLRAEAGIAPGQCAAAALSPATRARPRATMTACRMRR